MLTVDYGDLLRGVTEICLGAYPPKVQEAALFKGYLSRRLREAWESEWWPDLVRIESRTYRAAWGAATAYTTGTEVYDTLSNAYFQALRASTGQAPSSSSGGGSIENSAYWCQCQGVYSASNYAAAAAYAVGQKVFYPTTRRYYQCHTASTGNAPTDTGYWGVLTPFDPYLALEQAGETVIGHVYALTDVDPRVNPRSREIPFRLSHRGVQVPSATPVVWVNFRLRCPALSGFQWDSDTAYTAGQQVFATVDGVLNFYTATETTVEGDSPETAPDSWALVEIPAQFRDYLIYGAAADYMLLQAQVDKATAFGVAADRALSDETDILYRQQGQTQPLRVQTYSVPALP